MEYRRLGTAGLKLSALSYGSWITYGSQVDIDLAVNCMKAAYDNGVNFFDNAEVYENGKSEEIMGKALNKLGWRRSSYIVSTKLYWGLNDGPNEKNTLNRKYLMESIDGSLNRLGMDHVDLLYCHRPDSETPIEEVVFAMSDIISSGRAHYWGTSEWSAAEIMEAWQIAERHHLRKPQMEQPQYNLLTRNRVENEYSRLYEDIGLGLTTWSPLASGLLSGKYNNGIPEGSRMSLKGYEWLKNGVLTDDRIESVKKLGKIAAELDVSAAQLSLAWTAGNKNVSSVITGASRPEQVVENMKAFELVSKLDAGARKEIEELFVSD
jgi:voltage-dependent potassium channel beta subunit